MLAARYSLLYHGLARRLCIGQSVQPAEGDICTSMEQKIESDVHTVIPTHKSCTEQSVCNNSSSIVGVHF